MVHKQENMEGDELMDLVSEQDEVIGTALRSYIYQHNLKNVRVINAFIINDEGQLWIPTRGPNKRLFPLCLDMSVGGHVGAGESYEQTLIRETAEEANLDLTKIPYHRVDVLSPYIHEISSFQHIYFIFYNQNPNYNPEDFISFEWLYPEELLAKIQDGIPAKGDLVKIITKLIQDKKFPRTK